MQKLRYKYEVIIKAEVKSENGSLLYTVDGGTIYANERIKEQGRDNSSFPDGIEDTDRRFLVGRITDRIMSTIFKPENEKAMLRYINRATSEKCSK